MTKETVKTRILQINKQDPKHNNFQKWRSFEVVNNFSTPTEGVKNVTTSQILFNFFDNSQKRVLYAAKHDQTVYCWFNLDWLLQLRTEHYKYNTVISNSER